MNKKPLVSIITPSYNQGEFVEDMILSIKNQDYKNVEHIIVDGGSTDNTIDIIKKYEDSYNMKWISENDSGMYEAINKGLYIAKGEILAYLNTDDLYFPWTVSVIVEHFNSHLKIELIYGDAINIDLNTGKNTLLFCPSFNNSFLIRENIIVQPTVFFRKSIFKKVGFFNKDIKLVGDYEYWLRVGCQCNILKIKEILAVDRIHSRSQRQRRAQQLLYEVGQLREKYKVPTGRKAYLRKKLYVLQYFLIRRTSVIRFIFFYLIKKRKTYIKNSISYPWKNLIEFSGFHLISWCAFFLTMIPWLNRKYKKNWFILALKTYNNFDLQNNINNSMK